MSFQLDLGQKSLYMFFKYWELILKYLWSIQPSGANSREVWSYLRGTMPEPMSRASVIIFLHNMIEKGVLIEENKPRRGSYHGIILSKIQ